MLQTAGEISDLELQKKYVLQPSFKLNGKTYRSINYYADFVYFDNDKCVEVVEDVKSEVTRNNSVYKLKKKMMAYIYDIEIKEV